MMRLGMLFMMLALAGPAIAQTSSGDIKTRQNDSLYIIFDDSNSMWGELADKSRKIEAARAAFGKLHLGDNREVALRIYGHRNKADCQDSELVVPFAPANANRLLLKEAIETIKPIGKTPIALSLQQALQDMRGRNGEILLISDGIDSCGMDPCELVKEWQNKGISLKVHVVGVGLDDSGIASMQCIANTTHGQYYDVNNAEDFTNSLKAISGPAETIASTRVFTHLHAQGSKDRLVRDFVAMQNGKDIGVIKYAGGAELKPGIYDLEVRNSFTPFHIEGVELDHRKEQVLHFTISTGWAQFAYQFKNEPKTSSRIGRLVRLDENGSPMPGKQKIRQGEKQPLVAGTYRLEAWQPRGKFTPVTFTITVGEISNITLKEE